MTQRLHVTHDMRPTPRPQLLNPHPQKLMVSLTGHTRTGGTGMVVYSLKRQVVTGMPIVDKKDGQGPPRRDTMLEMPGKNQ